MPVSPGALHAELWIFRCQLKTIYEACEDPSKAIVVTDDLRAAITDALQRWTGIAQMLDELIQ